MINNVAMVGMINILMCEDFTVFSSAGANHSAHNTTHFFEVNDEWLEIIHET